jgi:hypothetical protein
MAANYKNRTLAAIENKWHDIRERHGMTKRRVKYAFGTSQADSRDQTHVRNVGAENLADDIQPMIKRSKRNRVEEEYNEAHVDSSNSHISAAKLTTGKDSAERYARFCMCSMHNLMCSVLSTAANALSSLQAVHPPDAGQQQV